MILKLLAAMTLLLALSAPAHAQRVALLIGNANYTSAPLTNPPNDVRQMEVALKKVGFKVQTVLNANQNQMKRALRDFGDQAQGAEVAFLYYSGHGTQAGGENYLIPIQASITKESDYEIEAVGANGLMRQIAGARPKTAIVVLDACRDNPFAVAAKSTTKGLGRMDAPTGSMIAFATAPNTTASDEGLYARELARQISTPGVELYDVFRNTTAEVQRQSKGKQVPRVSEVSITEKIYLAGPTTTSTQGPGVQIASVRAEPLEPVATQAAPAASVPRSRVIKDCADCPVMVVLPAGTFVMGSNAAEQAHANAADSVKNRTDRENPQHWVSVKSFAMGKFEVTRGQFAAFVKSSGHNAGNSCKVYVDGKWPDTPDRNWRNPGFSQTDNDPVACVNWDDAQAYVRWLSVKTGQSYRLPSEAEWEYACRAGANQTYCGSDNVDSVAWYGAFATPVGSSAKNTNRVGSKQANAWGLFDMSGNAWEWVQDCWNENYRLAPNDGSAWVSGSCERRGLRGGSWSNIPALTRAAFRGTDVTSIRHGVYGFRLARTLP